MRTADPATLFRRVAVAEAVTWALLLTGMFLKYVTETTELGVRVFGMVHGVVFIAYCLDHPPGRGRPALDRAAHAARPGRRGAAVRDGVVRPVRRAARRARPALAARAARARGTRPDRAVAWLLRNPLRGAAGRSRRGARAHRGRAAGRPARRLSARAEPPGRAPRASGPARLAVRRRRRSAISSRASDSVRRPGAVRGATRWRRSTNGDGGEHRRGEEGGPDARARTAPGTAPAAYTETITATPTALPSCWVVCSRPDAAPACSGSTPLSTVAVIGMKHQAGRRGR